MKRLLIYLIIFFNLSYLIILNGCSHIQATTSDSMGITGYVISENDSLFVTGSKVEILERHLKVITDINGKFSFYQLAQGSYTIRVSYVGCDTITVHDIAIPHKDQPLIIMLRSLDFCRVAADQARNDLARGKVYLMGAKGLIFLPAQKQIDQIDEKYGIQWYDTGCLSLSDCNEKYNSIVRIYLNLRNGKGWWNRYNGEVKKVYDSFK